MPTPFSIQIIEDNLDFASYLKELIEENGLGTVSLAHDGLEGLSAAIRLRPNVLVLDLDLPSLRGEEILRVLRSTPHFEDVRVLICSDMPREQRREMELLKLGADRYVEKPFVEEAFLDDIRELGEISTGRAMELHAAPRAGVDARAPGLLDTESTTLAREADNDHATQRELPPEPESDRLTPRVGPALQGEVFEGYWILDIAGAGNMGTVYRARQIRLNRVVALKVLLRAQREDVDAVERFVREAMIMAQAAHPNIVQVFDAGGTGYTCYLAMEYVEGGTVESRLRDDSLSWDDAKRILDQTFGVVSFLHGQNIVHRDLKPGNLLLDRFGNVKLGDFGISRARLPMDLVEFTTPGVKLGTPLYMAPELLVGHDATEKTDQYALGRTALRLFEGPKYNRPHKPLHEIRPDLPAALSAAIARCMAMQPENRFPSVKAAHKAIMEAMEQHVPTARGTLWRGHAGR